MTQRRYFVSGPFSGENDCEPPEPGKHWLTIFEQEGKSEHEVCSFISRHGPPTDAQWVIAHKIAILLEAHQ